MKKIILGLIILCAFSSRVYAEDAQIDPVLSNAMQSGIACESYLDGKFNNSISSLYFDIKNNKIVYISIGAWLPITPEEPATLSYQLFDIKTMDIIEPKRIAFIGTNEFGYAFTADISALNDGKILFNLKVSGRGIVEIKNISKQGLELKKKWAPGIYLGEVNGQK